jgi:transcriptional regulator with XRE-family HTH domain
MASYRPAGTADNWFTMSKAAEAGERIRLFRILEGYSQEGLATLLGTEQDKIARYEKGSRKPPTRVTLAIARMFKLNPRYLSEGKKPMYIRSLIFYSLPEFKRDKPQETNRVHGELSRFERYFLLRNTISDSYVSSEGSAYMLKVESSYVFLRAATWESILRKRLAPPFVTPRQVTGIRDTRSMSDMDVMGAFLDAHALVDPQLNRSLLLKTYCAEQEKLDEWKQRTLKEQTINRVVHLMKKHGVALDDLAMKKKRPGRP